MLLGAARRVQVPVLLFQARNDHDLTPHQALLAALQRPGQVAQSRVYPAYGTTAQQGHAFAHQGVAVWFADVAGFLERHCP